MPAAQSSPHRAKEKEIYIFYFFYGFASVSKRCAVPQGAKKEPRRALLCHYFNVMLLLSTVELYKNSTSVSVKSTKFPTMAGIM